MKKLLSTISTFRREIWSKPSNRDEKRKFCFAPELQRNIDFTHVKNLDSEMKDGWLPELPALIFAAENVNENMGREMQLLDINGVEIPLKKRNQYWLVVDSQHRLNYWADKMTSCPIEEAILEIPSIHITLRPGETLADYIIKINNGKTWETCQYIKSAANINPGCELLDRYRKYSLTKQNVEEIGKFSITTLNLIYYGSEKIVNKTKAEKIMKGLTTVPVGYNIKRGDRFIKLCNDKFCGIYTGRKELINSFNALRNELGADEPAFEIFNALTPGDIASMMVPKSKTKYILSESKVWEVLKRTQERINIS